MPNQANYPAALRNPFVGQTPLAEPDYLQNKKDKKRRARTFPEKLMQAMMEYATNEDAVAWLPDGKSFVIVDADKLVKDVLNPVFKQCKYASFVRKLHRWGFVRLTSGTGTDCFHHPLFQNGRKDLVSKISCAPQVKEAQFRKNRYRMEKPPSLAGVERFIRAKAEAAAKASATSTKTTAAVVNEDVGTIDSEGKDKTAPPPPPTTTAAAEPSVVAKPSVVANTVEETETLPAETTKVA